MIRALICLALCAVVLAQSPTCSSKLKAADGSSYDLSYFANTILQATQTDGGQVYTYNISICANSPYGCAGACSGVNTAGVCQSWGPAPTSAKCFGKWDTAKLTGLNSGHGFQIAYEGGDVCGSCNPQGPRTTVVTLICDPKASTQVSWGTPYGAQPGQPSIFYINGTSSHACPGGGNMDGGWIFIIIVVCLLFVYFVGGVVFNAAVKKQRGKEMVPNSEFWCDLPALIGDGFKFLIGKCTGKGGYTPVSA
jgi:hypothetical protein